MERKRLLKTLIFIIVFMFIVQVLATKFYWYYSIWYFDMPMHFIGGFWSGLFLIWALSYKNSPEEPFHKLGLKIILGVLLIGVAWELFEVFANDHIFKGLFLANPLDSVSDIFFDLSGGMLAVMYLFKKTILKEANKVQ